MNTATRKWVGPVRERVQVLPVVRALDAAADKFATPLKTLLITRPSMQSVHSWMDTGGRQQASLFTSCYSQGFMVVHRAR
jgi:hypothetical protein